MKTVIAAGVKRIVVKKVTISTMNERSPHVRESGILNPQNVCLWNPKSWALESGIPLTTGVWNPSTTDKNQNSVPGIRNPQPVRVIQNPRLSWIPLHGIKKRN